jgi:hypothetical protein
MAVAVALAAAMGGCALFRGAEAPAPGAQAAGWVSHEPLTRYLETYLGPDGRLRTADSVALQLDALDRYLATLGGVQVARWPRQEQAVLWLNAAVALKAREAVSGSSASATVAGERGDARAFARRAQANLDGPFAPLAVPGNAGVPPYPVRAYDAAHLHAQLEEQFLRALPSAARFDWTAKRVSVDPALKPPVEALLGRTVGEAGTSATLELLGHYHDEFLRAKTAGFAIDFGERR